MFDIFNLILSAIVFLIYSTTSTLALIFTFSREKYLEIETSLDCDLLSTPKLSTILEKDITWFHDWLILHNRSTGPILVTMSIIDLQLCFFIINMP